MFLIFEFYVNVKISGIECSPEKSNSFFPASEKMPLVLILLDFPETGELGRPFFAQFFSRKFEGLPAFFSVKWS